MNVWLLVTILATSALPQGSLAVACAALIASAVPAHAQATPSGRVIGTVVERGKTPIEFANVIILGTKLGTMTDANGNFVLTGVPVGKVEVQVQPIGFDKQIQTVQVNAAATTSVSFNFVGSKVVKQIEEIHSHVHSPHADRVPGPALAADSLGNLGLPDSGGAPGGSLFAGFS